MVVRGSGIYVPTWFCGLVAQLQPDQSHPGLGATPMPPNRHNRIIVVCQPFKLTLRLHEANNHNAGPQPPTNHRQLTMRSHLFSSRAGEYPFKCLIRSAVRRACIDRYKAEDVSFVVTYIFSGVLSGQDDFSLLSLSAPSLFLWLGRYALVQLGALHFPMLGRLITRLSGHALFCLWTRPSIYM